jgi:hypothetical protein
MDRQHPFLRALPCLFALVGFGLLAAPVAWAESSPPGLSVATARVVGDQLRYDAAAGVANAPVLDFRPLRTSQHQVVIVEANVDPGPGCQLGPNNTTVCTPAQALHSALVNLGDGNDHAWIADAGPQAGWYVQINAGPGDDRLHADTSGPTPANTTQVRLYGEAGFDSVYGGDGNDVLDGGADNDTVAGSAVGTAADADQLNGGPGNDVVDGGAGNDTITGGPGRDIFYGRAGVDRLVSADGEIDSLVDCGPGGGTATVDFLEQDIVTGCTTVVVALPPNDPLKSWRGPGDRWATTGATTAGYSLEATLGGAARQPRVGPRNLEALYGCLAGTDHFLSLDAACEGATVLRLEGYLFNHLQDQPTGTGPVYRCRAASGERFASTSRFCDAAVGTTQEGVLGYAIKLP